MKIIIDNERIIEGKTGKTLAEILADNGIKIEMPCGGKGTCKKCKVEVEGVFENACQYYPEGDISVKIPDKDAQSNILTSGIEKKFEMNPTVYKKVFEIPKTDLKTQETVEARIRRILNVKKIPLRALQKIKQIGEYTAVFYGDEILTIESGDTSGEIYGVAVDIGTTTVVASLVDLKTGEEISQRSEVNRQKYFGSDVLSRITYSMEHKDGLKELQGAIAESLNDMIAEMSSERNINMNYIYDIVISANSTMVHLLLGLEPSFIGLSPFVNVMQGDSDIFASEIGLKISYATRLHILPSVSAYIGADIVSGIYATSLNKTDDTVLFIDIGTNGEIVLSHNGELSSCSCAAGPALEGMNISIGMRAEEGAIEDIKFGEDKAELKVIGNTEPRGICGSGIIALMSELIRTGLCEKSGRLAKKSDDNEKFIIGDGKGRVVVIDEENDLSVTQNDIRQIQLAKGAILSGFTALLRNFGISMEELDRVVVAGQFGSHLSAESLVGSGILPKEVLEKIEYAGNSSKVGAVCALLSKDARCEMLEISNEVQYMELSQSENYERLFADCLIFK